MPATQSKLRRVSNWDQLPQSKYPANVINERHSNMTIQRNNLVTFDIINCVVVKKHKGEKRKIKLRYIIIIKGHLLYNFHILFMRHAGYDA